MSSFNRFGTFRIPKNLNHSNTGVTVELRMLVESGVKVWDFDYPTYYTGEKKEAFEQKVLEHFWFREIGQETPGRFLHYFRSKIREIMPYYIELYKSVELFNEDTDQLESYNLTETYTEEIEGSGSSTTTATGTNERLYHDTPQGSIQNVGRYLSEVTKEDNTGTGTGSSENKGKITHTLTRRGNIGVQTKGEEFEKNRRAILNVDALVIEELEELFLKVY